MNIHPAHYRVSDPRLAMGPTIVELALNFVGSMARWVKAGFKVTDEDEYNKRLETCKMCPSWVTSNWHKCSRCGCYQIKLWLSSEKCPLNKWLQSTVPRG